MFKPRYKHWFSQNWEVPGAQGSIEPLPVSTSCLPLDSTVAHTGSGQFVLGFLLTELSSLWESLVSIYPSDTLPKGKHGWLRTEYYFEESIFKSTRVTTDRDTLIYFHITMSSGGPHSLSGRMDSQASQLIMHKQLHSRQKWKWRLQSIFTSSQSLND